MRSEHEVTEKGRMSTRHEKEPLPKAARACERSNAPCVATEGRGVNAGRAVATPTVTVLMTVFNRREETLSCLEKLYRARDGIILSVVLVDDGSTDGTSCAVAERFADVTVVEGTGRLYWAGGMRRAFECALPIRSEYVLWLNNDVMLEPGSIRTLILTAEHLRQRRQAAIVVGAVRDRASRDLTYSGVTRARLRRMVFRPVYPSSAPRRADTMNGNVVLIPATVAERLGNLDPAFRHGLADYDYGLRAAVEGIEVWVAPGFAGECSRNGRPAYSSTPVARLRQRTSPKDIPARSWLTFTRRHGGPLWPVYYVAPYLKAVVGVR